MSSPINPYIAANPIRETEMFFGRQDVFRFVQETLVGRYQDNAIVLYGGRRTGKTSVLYQMGRYLGPRYVPVFVDLQGVSLEGLGEILPQIKTGYRQLIVEWLSNPQMWIGAAALLRSAFGG